MPDTPSADPRFGSRKAEAEEDPVSCPLTGVTILKGTSRAPEASPLSLERLLWLAE